MTSDIKKVCIESADDKIKVSKDFQVEYDMYYESSKIKKEVIYLNGVNFFNGSQGSGKTYLVKSILQSSNVNKYINNVFWGDTVNDMEFIISFLNYKKLVSEGLLLLYRDKLKGNYFKKWKELTEKTDTVVNKERFVFNRYNPNLYDLIILDDIASNPAVELLKPFATILRHIHCGLVFIGQTETILSKCFRDLLSLYITFSLPDKKIITNNSTRRLVMEMIKGRKSPREAVAIDFIEEDVYYISAESKNENSEDKENSESKKKSEAEKFSENLINFNF